MLGRSKYPLAKLMTPPLTKHRLPMAPMDGTEIEAMRSSAHLKIRWRMPLGVDNGHCVTLVRRLRDKSQSLDLPDILPATLDCEHFSRSVVPLALHGFSAKVLPFRIG